ncbi:DTW domain-containing protein [Pseudomonas sp. NPDC007930]|uniref:tRNA-uridine aminocarboxypropyltransferase n=1 Tax=Pseudomonas sp. NPDC007930 TaxID=3364417 RepID=UPI0036DFF46C
MHHAVSRLRQARLARSTKPFIARGSRAERCPQCRVVPGYCLCAWRPQVPSQAGMCLIMHDVEALKPTNTGWLIADVVADTYAFGWSRIEVDPQLLALLDDPTWQPYIVFPEEFGQGREVVQQVSAAPGKRPLFVLLDATWTEARKMFRKSPYLERFPVLSLSPEQLSRYTLRRSRRSDHFCTAEVGAMCLSLAGDEAASLALDDWLDAFSGHYLAAKFQRPINEDDALHQRLLALR